MGICLSNSMQQRLLELAALMFYLFPVYVEEVLRLIGFRRNKPTTFLLPVVKLEINAGVDAWY